MMKTYWFFGIFIDIMLILGRVCKMKGKLFVKFHWRGEFVPYYY